MRFDISFDAAAALGALDRLEARVNETTKEAADAGAELVQRKAREYSMGRPGPNYVSGEHWRGIQTRTARRLADGRWESMVVATSDHSAALENGSKRWAKGVKYPSMGPAVQWARSGPLRRVFIDWWRRL